MSGVRFDDHVWKAAGNVPPGAEAPLYSVPRATVQIVTTASVGTPVPVNVPIFSDQAMTVALSNPLTTDQEGNFGFFVAPGTYAAIVSSASGQPLDVYTITTGLTGPPGVSTTIAVGSVTTGAPGSEAVFENVGTASAAVFDVTLPTGATGPPTTFTGPYNAGTTYAAGVAASFNGASYVSLQAANIGHEPDTSPSWWGLQAKAGQGFNNRGAWAADTAYALYDVLTNGGNVYTPTAPFTSGSTFDATNLSVMIPSAELTGDYSGPLTLESLTVGGTSGETGGTTTAVAPLNVAKVTSDLYGRVSESTLLDGTKFIAKARIASLQLTAPLPLDLGTTMGPASVAVGQYPYVKFQEDDYGRVSSADFADGSKFIAKLKITHDGSMQSVSTLLDAEAATRAAEIAALSAEITTPTKAALLSALSLGGWPTVMATPPTMGLSLTSSIGGAVLDPFNSTLGRDLFATTSLVDTDGSSTPNAKGWASTYYGPMNGYGANGSAREVDHTGTKLEFLIGGQLTSVRVRVNGQIANVTPLVTANDGNTYCLLVDFTAISSSPVKRRIRIECSGTLHYYGLNLVPGETVAAPDGISMPVVGYMGDSFIEGLAGNPPPCFGMSFVLGMMMGWNMHSCGAGGTGLLNPNAAANRVNFQSRVSDLTGIANLALGIVQLSINDFGGSSWAGMPTTFSGVASASFAAMQNFITQYQAGTSAPLIVFGPTWTSGAAIPQAMYVYASACRQACAGFANVHYIDQYLDQLLIGTGNVGAPTGIGNCDFLVFSDGTHPSGTNDPTQMSGHTYRGLIQAQKSKTTIETEF